MRGESKVKSKVRQFDKHVAEVINELHVNKY